MSVRFAAAPPRVVTYALEEGERELKRAGSARGAAEARREQRLCAAVLRWQAAHPAQAARPLDCASLEQVLGRARAAAVRRLGVPDLAALLRAAALFVLEQWPSHPEGADRRDLEISGTVVLCLTAEFLCHNLRYELPRQDEQDCLFANIFHITRHILAHHFP